MDAGGSSSAIIIAQNFDNEVAFAASKTWKLTSLVVFLDLQSTIHGFVQEIQSSLTVSNYVVFNSMIQGLLMETQSKIHESCMELFIQQIVLVTSVEDINGLCYLKKYYKWMGIAMVPDGENFMFLRHAAEERHVVYSVWDSIFNMDAVISTQNIGKEVAVAAFIKAKLTSLVVYLGLMSRVQSLQYLTGDVVLQSKVQVFMKLIESKIDQICLRLRGEESVMVNSVEDIDAVCYLKNKNDWKGKAVVLDHGYGYGNGYGYGYGNGVLDNHSMALIQAAVAKNVSYFVCRKKWN